MSKAQYRVILYCSQSDADIVEHLKKEVAERFGLSEDALDKLFSGQPVIMRQSVDRAEADKWKKSLEAAGGVCEIEPVTRWRKIDEYGLVERRMRKRRVAVDRRTKPRSGKDRRVKDRRKDSPEEE